ncbi:MAG: NAD(P)H-binding protein [Jannaschia helgolandensis]
MQSPTKEGARAMTYAITAVSGQLGREIALKSIDKLGVKDVVGLARTPHHVKDLGIKVRPGDYDKPEELRASLQGIDALVLVSGMAAPEDRIQQHRNVIESAKDEQTGAVSEDRRKGSWPRVGGHDGSRSVIVHH